MMAAWGNQRANAYWEANMPKNRKPGRNAGDREMEEFIRDKYERKKWVDKGGKPKHKPKGESSQKV